MLVHQATLALPEAFPLGLPEWRSDLIGRPGLFGLVGAIAGALVGTLTAFLLDPTGQGPHEFFLLVHLFVCVPLGFLFGAAAGEAWAARRGRSEEESAELPIGSGTKHWDGRSRPMPADRVKVPFSRSFTDEEAERLKRGLIPRVVEDTWFGVLHPGSLDFYRSWTGFHIYRLPVREGPGGMSVGPLIVNDDPAQYRRRGDDVDLEMVHRLIGWMLEPPPAPSELGTGRFESQGLAGGKANRFFVGFLLTVACAAVGAEVGIWILLAVYRAQDTGVPDADPHGFVGLFFVAVGALGGSLLGLVGGVILAVRLCWSE
jgi:hypothetical protein